MAEALETVESIDDALSGASLQPDKLMLVAKNKNLQKTRKEGVQPRRAGACCWCRR